MIERKVLVRVDVKTVDQDKYHREGVLVMTEGKAVEQDMTRRGTW